MRAKLLQGGLQKVPMMSLIAQSASYSDTLHAYQELSHSSHIQYDLRKYILLTTPKSPVSYCSCDSLSLHKIGVIQELLAAQLSLGQHYSVVILWNS